MESSHCKRKSRLAGKSSGPSVIVMTSLYDGLPAEGKLRVVGSLESLGSLSQRINRLQRRGAIVAGPPCFPKGVFKFKTHEEAEKWMEKARHSRIANATPLKTI